jgi:hypothetical protein
MTKKQYRQFLMVLLAVTFCTVTGNSFGQVRPAALGPDTLYVTDELDGTVKSFSTQDGSRLGFTTQKGQLRAPMGLFVAGGELVVVNQNAGKPFSGEILQYLLRGGKLAGHWLINTTRTRPLRLVASFYLRESFTLPISLAVIRTPLSRARSTSLQEMANCSADSLRRRPFDSFPAA